MKVAIIVPVLTAAFLCATAQAQPPRPLLEIITKNKPQKNAAQPQAKLSAVTTAGKIYALPQDNMPCLVPHRFSMVQMPAAIQPHFKNSMPNASVVQPVIPPQ